MHARNQDRVWLVEHPIGCITGSQLPSNQQAFALFFYHHKILKKNVQESVPTVAWEIQVLRDKARIPTTQERNVISQIVHLFELWKIYRKDLKPELKPKSRKSIHSPSKFLESVWHCTFKCIRNYNNRRRQSAFNSTKDWSTWVHGRCG